MIHLVRLFPMVEYDRQIIFSELETANQAIVLISHRFSTARLADRILVIEKGTILEMGTHEELISKNGRYAELFRLQAMGYQ